MSDGIFNVTIPVVMAFPQLFEAKAFMRNGKPQGDPYFSGNFIFKRDNPDLRAMSDLAKAVAKAKWPGRDLKELKFPFTNGDKLADGAKAKGKDGEYQRGCVVVTAKSKRNPRLAIFEKGKIIDLETPAAIAAQKALFYPGALVYAQFNFADYPGVGANPDGVACYLNLVMTTGTGKRLAGAGQSAAEAFRHVAGGVSQEDPTAGGDEEIF